MRNKRTWLLYLLTGLLAMSMCFFAKAEEKEEYTEAINALSEGRFEDARAAFSTFTAYEESAQYALYAGALEMIKNQNYDDAITMLNFLDGFHNSDLWIDYAWGCANMTEGFDADAGFARLLEIERLSNGFSADPSQICLYDYISILDGDTALVCLEGKWGLLGADGSYIVSPKWDWASSGLEGISGIDHVNRADGSTFYFREKYKCGYMRNDGLLLLEPVWDGIVRYNDNLVVVNSQGKEYLYDIGARKIISDAWDIVNPAEGILKVKRNNKFGYIGTDGKEIISPEWDLTYELGPDLIAVYKNQKYGVLSTAGEIISPLQWKGLNIYTFAENMIFVRNNDNLWGAIDGEGNILYEPQWDEINWNGFSEGILGVMKDEKWGFINDRGETVNVCQWDEIMQYSEGMAGVRQGSMWGYINKTGELVIPLMYESIESFSNGTAYVRKPDEDYVTIDASGWYVKPESEPVSFGLGETEVINFGGIYSYVKLAGKWGVVDQDGKLCAPAIWDNISWINGEAIVKTPPVLLRVFSSESLKWGLIQADGTPVVPVD